MEYIKEYSSYNDYEMLSDLDKLDYLSRELTEFASYTDKDFNDLLDVLIPYFCEYDNDLVGEEDNLSCDSTLKNTKFVIKGDVILLTAYYYDCTYFNLSRTSYSFGKGIRSTSFRVTIYSNVSMRAGELSASADVTVETCTGNYRRHKYSSHNSDIITLYDYLKWLRSIIKNSYGLQ